MKPPKLRNVRAFTMVEILVALAIVSVLIAFLAPALGAAKEKANRAKCSSNMRQIGVAQFLYANDHEGWFWDFDHVVAGFGQTYTMSQSSWPTESPIAWFDTNGFDKYLKKSDVLYCPSRLRRLSTSGNPLSCQLISPFGSLNGSLRHYNPMRGMSTRHDARYILLYERTNYWNANFSPTAQPDDWAELWPYTINDDCNHGTIGSNILYVDGRVQWVKGNPGPFYGSSIAPPGGFAGGSFFYSSN
jgi:prepilin-type N-terminal cleavage/methylation domain-containing protein/prepilin-type processing-associated H-X9-DG protein